MVKFSREYEASIIPEWKATFVDYKGLKKLVKRIKIARRDAAPLLLAGREAGGGGTSSDGGGSNASSGSYGFSVLDPVRALAAHFAATPASPVRRVVSPAAARVRSCRASSSPSPPPLPSHTYIRHSSRTCMHTS
jgi:hypothetical protein